MPERHACRAARRRKSPRDPSLAQSSSRNVASIVTRYSAILPCATLALCSITCSPVMPRIVLLARASPSWTAVSKLLGEAAVILLTRATAIVSSLMRARAERDPRPRLRPSLLLGGALHKSFGQLLVRPPAPPEFPP